VRHGWELPKCSAYAAEAREAFVSGRRDGCLQEFTVMPAAGKFQPAITFLPLRKDVESLGGWWG